MKYLKSLIVLCLFCFLVFNNALGVIYVDKDATSGADNGTSWANAYTNLNTALTKSTGEFWVAEGTYTVPSTSGAELNSTNELYGGFQGTESSRTERNWTTYPTIFDGGSSNRVLQKTVAGTAILDGFTVRNGANAGGTSGGGLYCTDGSINIRNCTFTNNLSGGYGGAIYHAVAVSNSFSNCTFIANAAGAGSGYRGGAVFFSTKSTNVFMNCTFVTNNAVGSGAGSGGAIRENEAGGLLVLTDCTFSNNVSGTGGGGAIYAQGTLDLSGANNVFSTNVSTGGGGAIYHARAGADNVFSNSTFTANVAGSGHGGALYICCACTNRFANCAFITNSISGGNGSGGAIYVQSAGTHNLINSTFFANRATGTGQGGAIMTPASSLLNVTNCIFWNNYAGGTGDEIQNGGTLNLGYSCINTNTGYIDGGTLNFGAGIINADPLFASEVEPYDVHLKSVVGRYSNGVWVVDSVHSPCIDAGDPTSDWLNEPSPNGSRINLGRYGNTIQASKTVVVTTVTVPNVKNSVILNNKLISD